MYGLYAPLINESQFTADQCRSLKRLRQGQPLCVEGATAMAGGHVRKNFATGEDWLTGFFKNGAAAVVDMYAENFVWEDIEFGLTITDREELFKFFTVFDDAGPDSPYGVHTFELISYDGQPLPVSKAVLRQEGVPAGWNVEDYQRLANPITLGADFEYDEFGYMQWVWKAQHNSDFFGIPAAGKTTVTRGTSTQFYRHGKIVRCRTHWNFREFAMQLGIAPTL